MNHAEYIVRHVLEQTAYVSLQFLNDIQYNYHSDDTTTTTTTTNSNSNSNRKSTLPPLVKYYDCEYVLPNYITTFIGRVQIPELVQNEILRMMHNCRTRTMNNNNNNTSDTTSAQQRAVANSPLNVNHDEKNDDDDEDDDDENDEDYNENDMPVEEDVDDDGMDDHEDPNDNDDDEEESSEQIRMRLLKEREEERRLREMESEQDQILKVSMERFAIPEALFRPSDVGLPTDWANLPQTIVQAIEACPWMYRAGLYGSIQLTGGLSQLPNLKQRLELELRALAPCQYPINITTTDTPIDQAWKGAVNIVRQEPIEKWSIGRDEWESSSKRGAWKRLLMSKGGYIV
jgi:actin-related protein